MGIDAVHIITSAASYALELFTTMLEATGLTDFYFAMLAILLIVTFLLGGFLVSIPGSGSDLASISGLKGPGRKSKYDTRPGRSTSNTGSTGSNSGNTKGIGKF